MDTSSTDRIASCIAACNDCSRVCLQHIEHCLGVGGEHAESEHITMLLSCATVCRATSELMAIGSEWHATMCDLCAQVCEECADACEELGDMEDCVTACQECAEECRSMVDDEISADEEEADDESETASERMN